MTDRRDIHNSETPAVCVACEARHKGVCGALTADQLTRLNQYTTKVTMPRGKQLQGIQDSSNSYSNILGGVVKLSKLMADERQQISGRGEPGPDVGSTGTDGGLDG